MKTTKLDIFIIVIMLVLLMGIQTMVIKETSKQKLYVKIVTPEKTWQEPLSEDKTVFINGPLGKSILEIENYQVRMTDAPCKQKICIKTGKITRSGENIICIPNKIIVTITGKNEKFDEVTR